MAAVRRNAWAVLLLAAGAIATAAPASAGGLLDLLFGGFHRPDPPASASAYANPNPLMVLPSDNPGNPGPAQMPVEAPRGPAVAYCVRTCDGRYFPIQRHAGTSPAQACNSFCPGSATQVLNGSSIDSASAGNGTRYADLENAFVYRTKIIPGCTCNGKETFGVAPVDVTKDPTLRSGDIVATNAGLVAYRGTNSKASGAQFTPVSTYSGISNDVRKKLLSMKIDARPQIVSELAAPDTGRTAKEPADRRAQLSR